MKLVKLISPVLGIALLLAGRRIGFSQGFLNLNFESARIVPISGGDFGPNSIAVTNALPGWVVLYEANQQTQITYNDPALGSTFVTLWATNGQNISGNFSVLLQGGLTASAASISQSSLVPVSAMSLLFEAQSSGTGLSVSIGGQNIPFAAVSNGPNYVLYGADISAFAGQTAELRISALNISKGNDWNLDNIQFSNQPIPEPSELALVVTGALFLGLCRWRKPML